MPSCKADVQEDLAYEGQVDTAYICTDGHKADSIPVLEWRLKIRIGSNIDAKVDTMEYNVTSISLTHIGHAH